MSASMPEGALRTTWLVSSSPRNQVSTVRVMVSPSTDVTVPSKAISAIRSSPSVEKTMQLAAVSSLPAVSASGVPPARGGVS